MGNIIKNPYTTDGNWYVGQLHFHTAYNAGTNATGSDGSATPAQMETAYHDAGYDFIISTDHRSTTYPGGGVTADPAGTDLLWILGEEIDSTEGHIPLLGIDAAVNEPYSKGAAQTDIDNARTANGIAMLAHPGVNGAHWAWWSEVQPLLRFSLIEIKNGYDGLDHWSVPIDLADEYRQVWWTGVDDAHTVAGINTWCVVVQTGSASIAEADILSSLDSGNFYVRQTAAGPTISSVSVSGQVITITLPSGSYTVTWYKKGKRIAETDTGVTTTASYTVTGTEGYIFAEINDGSLLAYTQPLFILNDTDLSSSAAASEGTAANLIDNNTGTTCDWTATTGNFTIDLGAAKQANGIRITWNVSGTERWNYKIEESSTGVFGGEETEILRTSFSNRDAITTDVFDVWTRYIKVTITGASVGSSNVSVKEVEVFDASPEISEYYIDNVSGADANTGFSTGAAWSTIAYSLPLIRPRDRLNFIKTATPYTIIATNAVGNYALGKHAGAKWYLRGLSWPVVTSDASNGAIYIVGQVQSFLHVSGFACTGSKYGIYIYGGATPLNNIEIVGNKCYSNTVDGLKILTGATEVTIASNLFYSNTSIGGNELAAVGYTSYWYNNVFYGNGLYGLALGQAANTTATVKNNISSGNTSHELVDGSGTVVDSNNCNDGTYSGTWAKTNDITASPQFINAAGGDFRLRATSPCLRAGVSVGLTADIAGNTVPAWTGKAPDIGAYENRPGGVFIF